MNEDYNYKEIEEMIIAEMGKTYTIEEALKEREDEEKLVKDSFDSLWKNYNAVEKIRHDAIKNMREVKYKIILSNLLWLLIRYDVQEEINIVIDLMSKATNEIKDQKEILKIIKETIQKLQAHMAYTCNYDLAMLLSYIYDKNVLIYDEVSKEMNASASRIRGFGTQTPDYSDKKQELDEKINDSIIKLGLKK